MAVWALYVGTAKGSTTSGSLCSWLSLRDSVSLGYVLSFAPGSACKQKSNSCIPLLLGTLQIGVMSVRAGAAPLRRHRLMIYLHTVHAPTRAKILPRILAAQLSASCRVSKDGRLSCWDAQVLEQRASDVQKIRHSSELCSGEGAVGVQGDLSAPWVKHVKDVKGGG